MNGGSIISSNSSNVTKYPLSPATLFTINGNVLFKSVYVADITDGDQGIKKRTSYNKKKTLQFIYPDQNRNKNIGDNRQYIIKIDYNNDGPTEQITLNNIYIGASIDISFNNESQIIIKISQSVSYISTYNHYEVDVSATQSSTNDINSIIPADGSKTKLIVITPRDYIIYCNDDAIKYNNTLDLVTCRIHYLDNGLPDEEVRIIPGFTYHIGSVVWGDDDEVLEPHVVEQVRSEPRMPSTRRSRRQRTRVYPDDPDDPDPDNLSTLVDPMSMRDPEYIDTSRGRGTRHDYQDQAHDD